MSRFTVLGAGGFIGRRLVLHLRAAGHEVLAVERAGLKGFLAGRFPAGHVIDCIGLTGDFRERRPETAEAHVGVVATALARDRMASFLLLSSTRVYARAASTREETELVVAPMVAGDVYNITKLAGEALCLGDPRAEVRVAPAVQCLWGRDGAALLPWPGSYAGSVDGAGVAGTGVNVVQGLCRGGRGCCTA